MSSCGILQLLVYFGSFVAVRSFGGLRLAWAGVSGLASFLVLVVVSVGLLRMVGVAALGTVLVVSCSFLLIFCILVVEFVGSSILMFLIEVVAIVMGFVGISVVSWRVAVVSALLRVVLVFAGSLHISASWRASVHVLGVVPVVSLGPVELL